MQTSRLSLCFFLLSCLLTLCLESVETTSESLKDGLSSSNAQIKKYEEEGEWSGPTVVLVHQPKKEVQCKPFRFQPKLLINNKLDNVNANESDNVIRQSYYVTATLRQDSDMSVNASLTGNDTVEFVNNWANFTNLAISHYGQKYWLEFSICASVNDSCVSSVTSSPFEIAEFPFTVGMIISEPAQLEQETFIIAIILSLWDFTKNAIAQPSSLNDTIWYYSISLCQNGSTETVVSDEKNGTFPLRGNRSPLQNFSLTSIGYRYQFDITIHSPSFATRVKKMSDPFDVLWKVPDNDSKYSTIALTFNGSSQDIYGAEEKFCTIFLNHFGRLHSDVLWTEYTIRKSEEFEIQVKIIGKTKNVDAVVKQLWEDAKSSHYMPFNDKTFMLKERLEIDGEPYYDPDMTGHHDIIQLFGLPVTSVFTIVLMSFLCSAFVILVIIWRVREKKVLESYNRRMKSRSRPNGHVNTAFDSNESVPEKNVYYMAVNGRHNKDIGFSSERESRVRRCSSGGFHRSYRRMRRMGSDDGDTYVAANGVPLDDDIVFPDAEKHDDVFRDVYFSPTSECLPTFASSSSSFHDEYLLKDVQAHSGRANYAHIPMHKYKGSKRKCSVTASTVSGSLNSLPTSRSVSRMLSNSTIDSYSLHRPPVGWSSHDDNKICNGSRGLTFANPTFG